MNTEKMIEGEEQDLKMQVENLHKEIDKLNGELSHMVSDIGILKDTIVIMSMKMVGVVN